MLGAFCFRQALSIKHLVIGCLEGVSRHNSAVVFCLFYTSSLDVQLFSKYQGSARILASEVFAMGQVYVGCLLLSCAARIACTAVQTKKTSC